jgi:hypothetical protein
MLTRRRVILAGIVEDSYALSVARKQTLTSLLRLLNAYHDESDYTVLSHVTSVSKSCTSGGLFLNLVSLIELATCIVFVSRYA